MPNRSNSARYLWGDRNPQNVSVTYIGAGIAPHANVVRATVTIPADKKAKIHGASMLLAITTAAVTGGLRRIWVVVVIGGISYDVLHGYIGADRNTVGNFDTRAIGEGWALLPGHIINLYTGDNSNGGTMDYSGAALITQYDA